MTLNMLNSIVVISIQQNKERPYMYYYEFPICTYLLRLLPKRMPRLNFWNMFVRIDPDDQLGE